MYTKFNKCAADKVVTRIEYKYLLPIQYQKERDQIHDGHRLIQFVEWKEELPNYSKEVYDKITNE